MSTIDYEAEENSCQAEVARHLHWNMTVNVLDGVFVRFGMSFAATATILPLYARHFTDNAVLIGLIAAISAAGFYLPQLPTADYVRRQPLKKRVAVNMGFFAERLPVLVLAASTVLFAARVPGLALLSLFVALSWQHLGAGLTGVGYLELLAKVFPVQYRGRLLGTASSAGAVTGMVGASLAAAVLRRYPFPTNFALCFAVASLFTVLAWGWLALTREPPLHSRAPAVPFNRFLAHLPQVLRSDRNFAHYLVARVACVLSHMGLGFLTVYAANRWGLDDAQAGLYGLTLLVGQAAANLMLGSLADRRGHKLVLEITLVLGILAMLSAVLAPAPVWIYAIFAAVGAMEGGARISAIAIAMEFSSPDDRPTYLGLANTIPGLFSAIAPVIGGAIASVAGYRAAFLAAAACGMAALALMRTIVREPRRQARAD